MSWLAPHLAEAVTHRVLLMRHGAVADSARGLCYGRSEVALSAAGRDTVERVAAAMPMGLAASVMSSPSSRAVNTASIVAARLDAPMVCDPRLAELDFGELDGLTYDEAARRFPAVYAQWMAAPTDVQFPAGESFADVRARVAGVLADVATAASAGPRSVVVVTHGGPIRAALVQALGMNPAHAFRLAHDCAAVSCIDYYTSGCVVRAVNWLP